MISIFDCGMIIERKNENEQKTDWIECMWYQADNYIIIINLIFFIQTNIIGWLLHTHTRKLCNDII